MNNVASGIKSINEKKFAVAVSLDLSKVFDRVNHNILLKKIDKYGIRGTTLQLTKSYLTGRTQKIIEKTNEGKLYTIYYFINISLI